MIFLYSSFVLNILRMGIMKEVYEYYTGFSVNIYQAYLSRFFFLNVWDIFCIFIESHELNEKQKLIIDGM